LGSSPVVTSAPGSAAKAAKAKEWLKKARHKLEKAGGERRSQELYTGPGSDALKWNQLPPLHTYTNTQFCAKNELPKNWKGIKVLGDGSHGIALGDCHDFDGFLHEDDRFLRSIAEEGRDLIKEKPEFLGAKIRSLMNEQQKRAVEKGHRGS